MKHSTSETLDILLASHRLGIVAGFSHAFAIAGWGMILIGGVVLAASGVLFHLPPCPFQIRRRFARQQQPHPQPNVAAVPQPEPEPEPEAVRTPQNA